ncbi:hypothetical protein H4R35_001077 [Dimargaris xerosporica]|nr:hypothetical protein H4R35_001077 [Dimargaris xerosporica]
MGSKSSKVTRHYPKSASQAIKAPARTAEPTPNAVLKDLNYDKLAESVAQEKEINSQVRQNLGEFFAPRESVAPLKLSIAGSNRPALRTLNNRHRSDDFVQLGVRNKLSADALQHLLVVLKEMPNRNAEDIQALCKQFNLDLELLQALDRYYTSPMSLRPTTAPSSSPLPSTSASS